MRKSLKLSPQMCELAMFVVQERSGGHEPPSLWSDIGSISAKVGCVSQTLHTWVEQHEFEAGRRDDASTAEALRITDLVCENRDSRKTGHPVEAGADDCSFAERGLLHLARGAPGVPLASSGSGQADSPNAEDERACLLR